MPEQLPEIWIIAPFVILLLMIATGPLFYKHFWHKYYPHVSVAFGLIVMLYYIFKLDNIHQPIHVLYEYISFIALLASLFFACSGILINVNSNVTPLINVAFLFFAAVMANFIGTTGASILLIRPFIRLNTNRIKAYHIIFFIFIVSNIGGCLTPIGDPPLFLGFLKGVPFFWTFKNLWVIYLVSVFLLIALFYLFDIRNKNFSDQISHETQHHFKIKILGKRNIIWLIVIVGAVFLDPSLVTWLPCIKYHNMNISFIREIIMIAVSIIAYKTSNKYCLKKNEFSFEPIKEVAFLFLGLFATMMPAIELVAYYASSDIGKTMITSNSLYWFTGMLSSVLDNAPTYVNAIAAGMGKLGLDVNSKQAVVAFANHETLYLVAISVAAVFFGAMTYIGNAPNFMVRSIAQHSGIKMPSFFAFIIKYSLPILLPVLIIIWLLFIN